MVDFLVEKRAYSMLRGNTIWQQMEEMGTCGGRRTWQSMKEHFKKQLITRIHTFGLTWQQVRKFRAALGHDEPLQSSEEEEDDNDGVEHVEEGSIRKYIGSSGGSSVEQRRSSPLGIARKDGISPVNVDTVRQGSVGGSPVLRQSPRTVSPGDKIKEVAARGNQSVEQEGHRPRERKRKLFSKVSSPEFLLQVFLLSISFQATSYLRSDSPYSGGAVPSPVFRPRTEDSEGAGKKRITTEGEDEPVQGGSKAVEKDDGSSSKLTEVKRKDPRREREPTNKNDGIAPTSKNLEDGSNREENLVLRSVGPSRSRHSQTGDDLTLRSVGPKGADDNQEQEGDLVLKSQGPNRRDDLKSGGTEGEREVASSEEEEELILKSSGPSRLQPKNFLGESNSGSSELLGEDELCLMLEESDVPSPTQTPVSDRSEAEKDRDSSHEEIDDEEEEEEEEGNAEDEDVASQSLDELFGKVIADMEKDLSDLPDMFTDDDEQSKVALKKSKKKKTEDDSMFISSMSQPLLAAARRKSRETSNSKDGKTNKKHVDDNKRKQEREKEKREAEILKEILREKKRKSRELRAGEVGERGEKEKYTSVAEKGNGETKSGEEDMVEKERRVKGSKDDKIKKRIATEKVPNNGGLETDGKEQQGIRIEEVEVREEVAGSSKSTTADRENIIRELEEWGEREVSREVNGRVGEAGSSRSPGRYFVPLHKHKCYLHLIGKVQERN